MIGLSHVSHLTGGLHRWLSLLQSIISSRFLGFGIHDAFTAWHIFHRLCPKSLGRELAFLRLGDVFILSSIIGASYRSNRGVRDLSNWAGFVLRRNASWYLWDFQLHASLPS